MASNRPPSHLAKKDMAYQGTRGNNVKSIKSDGAGGAIISYKDKTGYYDGYLPGTPGKRPMKKKK